MIGRRKNGFKVPNAQSQKGLTLVEILVTVVIISVGLLGVAALHLTSLRNGVDSANRSKAIWLAHDIFDKMRANRTQALNGDYTIAVGAAPSGSALADADLISWKNSLATALPSGDGAVEVTPANVYRITIQWAERDSSDPVSFVTESGI